MSPTTGPALPPSPARSRASILAELAEVRRHLTETPPHSGAGVRERLEARRRQLERELANHEADDDRSPRRQS